jgi:Tfp pilus assembly protein PilO
MRRSFKLPEISVKDPRVVMRAIIGILLAANLTAAVLAFHPFGGGADDLRRQQQSLTTQLSQLQAHLKSGKELVAKVQTARTQGDEFMSKYFMSSQQMAYMMVGELYKSAKDSGIKVGTQSFSPEEIEGSDTLHMLSTQVGLEGSYANLAKFVNLLDKSPRFLIIESMTAAAPQQQQQGPRAQAAEQGLTVTIKVDAFIKDASGAAL